jgi:predicted RNA-binding Zn ribbon-like protein
VAQRSPAPGSLEDVRAFVNTLDVESGQDTLTEVGGLRAWLVDRGLLDDGAVVTEDDLQRARRLREARRGMLRPNHDREPPTPSDLAVVNEFAEVLTVRFTPDGWEIIPAHDGVGQAVGHLLGRVVSAMGDGTWARLKVCVEDTCQWAFYDASRNRSGRWCSMAVCGNRTKVRAFRERQAGG